MEGYQNHICKPLSFSLLIRRGFLLLSCHTLSENVTVLRRLLVQSGLRSRCPGPPDPGLSFQESRPQAPARLFQCFLYCNWFKALGMEH